MSSSLENQLLSLEDIITPEGVSLWPLTIAWWLLIVVSIVAVVGLIIFYRRYQKKWGYRQEALNLLKAHKNNLNNSDIAIKYLECLKRTAISAYPNQDIDSLYGDAWLSFLNRQTPKPLFNSELADFIRQAQYKKIFNLENEHLYKAIERWIKQHSINYPAKDHKSIKGDSI